MKPSLSEAACWQAVLDRDGSAPFFYAVRTTGIYCRPGCPSRRPRRENLSFFPDAASAEAAGFRPCKRCGEPVEDWQAGVVARACRVLETAAGPVKLAALAREVGVSPFHFHRLFRQQMGMTPRAYAAGCRAERVRTRLASGERVTDALYAAGYPGANRFYAEARKALGMAPAVYRNGGAGERLRYATTPTSLGVLLVAASEKGVCFVALGDEPGLLTEDLRARFPRAILEAGGAPFRETIAAVAALVEAPAGQSSLPLDIRGTAFQQRVWEALREIPPGETVSYSQLAERVGLPKAVRAVAQACGANRLALLIPCHRVVGRDGSLTGYRWGTERKRRLLERERA